MIAKLASLTQPCNALSSESVDAATPESVVEEGLDTILRLVSKVVIEVTPDLKSHGTVPQSTDVGAGLSLNAAAPLKDSPGDYWHCSARSSH